MEQRGVVRLGEKSLVKGSVGDLSLVMRAPNGTARA